LISACRKLFGNKYKITHAVWPYVHSEKTIGLLGEILDGINIMTYQEWPQNIEYLVKLYNKTGFPFEKMILGMETETEIEDVDSIYGKLQLINKYNLSGIFEWRLDNDGIPRISGKSTGPPTFKTTKMLYDLLNKNRNFFK
jgi:GH18 family chitinase